MNSLNRNTKRYHYNTPQIERIVLDNEISLILQSGGDNPDGEPTGSVEYFNNDPFKNNIA